MVFRFPSTLGLVVVVAGMMQAETLSQGDRDFALSSLHGTRKLFLDSIDGLSQAQWNFKPAPDRWSIAECAEHIYVTEQMVGGMIQKTPADPNAARMKPAEARAKDEKIVAMTADRSQKFQAPESIQPKKQMFKTPQEAAAAFKKLRDADIEYIDTTQTDLRAVPMQHPVAGKIDGLEMMLLVSAHSERHTKQILEVKADPKYPKK